MECGYSATVRAASSAEIPSTQATGSTCAPLPSTSSRTVLSPIRSILSPERARCVETGLARSQAADAQPPKRASDFEGHAVSPSDTLIQNWTVPAETRRTASLQDCDHVADANRTRRKNLGPQSSAVQQALDHGFPRHFLQVIAGLAQADAANAHIADGKLLAHQLIQWYVASHDVAARFSYSEHNAVVPPQRLNRLHLHQRQVVIRLGLEERAQFQRVSVTLH